MKLALLADLKDRDLAAEGVCVGEGRFAVERMLVSGLEPLALASVPGMASGLTELTSYPLSLEVLPQPEIAAIAGYPFHRGLIGAFRRPLMRGFDDLDLSPGYRVFVLDAVTDPVNLGGIIRSAAAFAIDAVLLGAGCADPWSRRGIRASMATCFSLPLARVPDAAFAAERLRHDGARIVGAALEKNSVTPDRIDTSDALALVMGNEGQGLGDAWRLVCDEFVRIPVSSRVDSLNVGVAAGILMYQLAGMV